jgi:two-component system sensor histidine kinase GlrK
MKIATKITAGYGVLIALMIISLVYHISLIHQMESINRDLSNVSFRAAVSALQLRRNLDQIKEFTQKFFISGSEYAGQLEDMHKAFGDNLHELRSLARSEKERREVERLSQVWGEFKAMDARRQELAIEATRPPEGGDLLPRLLKQLDQLRVQTELVGEVSQAAIQSQVQESAQAGQRAGRIALAAAAVALVLSILVSSFLIRSISDPLNQLTEGTRAIAAGKFLYQLETSRNDEFAQLARDFNTMTQRLNELDQMKRDFISHVSHELKAPLSSMQETTRLLLEQIPGPLTEKQKRLLELNLQSAKRLFSMIANLLDLSRLEAGVMDYEFKPQDLAPLIQTVLAELEARAREKNLCLQAELPPPPVMVECDGDCIVQVISNLLDNAMKFSPKDAAIKIRLDSTTKTPERLSHAGRQKISRVAHRTGFVIIAVSDSGPGVIEAHKEMIFQKFHQVKQGKKRAGQGVGLGLAICRTIVEAHQGAIWVEDNPEGGSVFFVSLPAVAVQRGHVGHRASSAVGVSLE